MGIHIHMTQKSKFISEYVLFQVNAVETLNAAPTTSTIKCGVSEEYHLYLHDVSMTVVWKTKQYIVLFTLRVLVGLGSDLHLCLLLCLPSKA